MNYLSGALRYVAGADERDGDGEEVRRLVERIKSASLAADRRAALKALTDAAASPARRAEIGEVGLKAFYAVLEQDAAYPHNVIAVLALLGAVCNADERDPAGRSVAATNIDAFLGLPDALSLVLDQLAAPQVDVRTAALELLISMAAYSRHTLQAALLDASAGVTKVCDCIDDAAPAVRTSAVVLLTMICTKKEEVAKIVAFSGVPDKLFEIIAVVNPKTGPVLAAPDAHDEVDALLSAAMRVHDILDFFGVLIATSSSTRVSLREVAFVPRSVELLKSLMCDSGVIAPNSPIDLASAPPHLALFKQNAVNIARCLDNIASLIQGTPDELRAMTAELASTDIFSKCQALAFLPYVEVPPPTPEPLVNIDLAVIRKAAFVLMSALVRSDISFRKLYYQSLCASQMTDAATPQICTVHTMLNDRSAALRTASYVALRESFILDPELPTPAFALLNAFTGSSSLNSLVQHSGQEMDVEDEEELDIPSKYLAILGEALKDALTLYPKGSDEAAVFHAAALLAWTLSRVQGARERLLAAFAHNAGNSLFPQVMRVLGNAQRMKSPPIVRIGLLLLVASWLHESPSAVSAFLSSAMHLPMIVEILQKGVENDEAADAHVKGLAAVVLGICLDVTDGENAVSGESGFITGGRGPAMVVPRGTISDVVRNHIGITVFTTRLEDLKVTPQFLNPLTEKDTWGIADAVQKVENNGVFYGGSTIGHEQYYDVDVVSLINKVVAQVASKAMDLLPTSAPNGGPVGNGSHEDARVPGPTQPAAQARTMEMLIADSAKDEQLNSYKEFIKAQEGNIIRLQDELRQAQGKISVLEATAGDTNPHHSETLNGTTKVNVGRSENHIAFNGVSPGVSQEVEDLTHRTRELSSVVSNLNEELEEAKSRSTALQDTLERTKLDEEEWRRKALEAQDVVDKERSEKEDALSKVAELSESMQVLRNDTSAKAEEMGASSVRVSELEDRCEELKEMRKRAETEVNSLKKEVEVRAEQNIELSGRLYEAEEKSITLEDARVSLTKKLAETQSALHVLQTTSQRSAGDTQELTELKSKLEASEKKYSDLVEQHAQRATSYTDEVAELRSRLDSSEKKYKEAVEQHAQSGTGYAHEVSELQAKLDASEKKYTEAVEKLARSGTGYAHEVSELQAKLDASEKKYTEAVEQHAQRGTDYAQEVSELTTKLDAAEKKCKEADYSQEVSERKTNLITAEVTELKTKLDAAEKKCEEANEQHVQLAAKLAETEKALKTASSTPLPGYVSMDEVEEARSRLAMAVERASALEESRETLASKLAETEALLRSANIAVSESVRMEELDVVKNKLAFAEDWNRKMEGQFKKQIENEKSAAEKKLCEAEAQRVKLVEKLTDMEGALEVARTTVLPGYVPVQEVDDARNQLSMALEKAAALEESREKLGNKLTETEASLRAAKIAVSESVKMEELDVMKNKLAFAEDWNRKMEEQFKKQIEHEKEKTVLVRNELTGELEEERKKMGELEQALKEKVELLGAKSAELCVNEAALESAEVAKNEALERIGNMQTELDEAKQMGEELENTRNELRKTQESLATQVASRQNERTSRTLENRIATLESERVVLKQKLTKQKEAFEAKIVDLQHDFRNALETVEATKAMYRESEKAAQQAAAKASAEMGAKDSELRSTRSELDRKAKIVLEMEEAKAAVEAAHEDDSARANLKLEEALKNLDMVAMEKDKVDGRVVELTKELTGLRKERDASVAQVAALEQKVAACEAATEELEVKVGTLITQNEKMATALQDESAALRDARDELAVVKRELEEESQRLRELSVKYEEHKVLEAEHNELLVCLAELEMECNGLKSDLGRS